MYAIKLYTYNIFGAIHSGIINALHQLYHKININSTKKRKKFHLTKLLKYSTIIIKLIGANYIKIK